MFSLCVSKMCFSCRQWFYFHVNWAYKPEEQEPVVLNISFEAGVPEVICSISPCNPGYFIQPDDISLQDKGQAQKVISDDWNPAHRMQVPWTWLQDVVLLAFLPVPAVPSCPFECLSYHFSTQKQKKRTQLEKVNVLLSP